MDRVHGGGPCFVLSRFGLPLSLGTGPWNPNRDFAFAF